MAYGIEEAIAGAKAARVYMGELGLRSQSWHDAVVIDRALTRGLEVTSDTRGRARISDGQQSWWYRRGNTNFNRPMAVKCTRHKEVTNALLRAGGLYAPRNMIFETRYEDRAWAWSESALPVVLKPSSHTLGGKHVHVGITERSEFKDAFRLIGETYGRVLVEEYVSGVEHRVLTIGNDVFGVIRREPARVIGDGFSTVGALAEEKSRQRLAAGNPLHGKVKIDNLAIRELRRQGLSLDSVPPTDHVVHLRATSNTHFGGEAVDATDELSSDEFAFVQRAVRVFPGLNLAGFDVLLPRDGQGADPCIIEINSNPAIALHHFPVRGDVRDAAGRLLDRMFPSSGRAAIRDRRGKSQSA